MSNVASIMEWRKYFLRSIVLAIELHSFKHYKKVNIMKVCD